MYQLTIEQSFDAAHFLAEYRGKCGNIQLIVAEFAYYSTSINPLLPIVQGKTRAGEIEIKSVASGIVAHKRVEIE